MSKTDDPLRVLRSNLNVALKQRRWSTMHLAVVCDLSVPTINNILSCRVNNVCLSTVIKIAEGLDVPVSTLIDDTRADQIEQTAFINRMYREAALLLGKEGAK